jgi:hypothetical protein
MSIYDARTQCRHALRCPPCALQVFAKWVFDEGIQCHAANIDTAICADVAVAEVEVNLQAVIPWLGGDYNPWEACDSHQSGSLVDGEFANEEIESSCHPLICPKGPPVDSYYRNHPTSNIERYRCAYRDRQVVTTTRNVKSSHKTNLCKQAPIVPTTCSSAHGMLMNLQGRNVPALYGEYIIRWAELI